jgi:hypothetical protein
MPTYSQGDLATIQATVEISVQGGAQVIVKAPNGTEGRIQVHRDAILSVKKGPLKAGDKVSKTVKRNKLGVTLTGVVEQRTAKKFLMVAWDDEAEEATVEKENILTRL